MKKLIPLILFCLILCSKSFGQTEISEIRFHFFPAFIASSDFDFNFKMASSNLEYEIFTPYYKVEHTDSLVFSNDIGLIVSRGMELEVFKERIKSIDFPKQKKLKRGYDGISITLEIEYSDGSIKQVKFNSPSRNEDTVAYEYLDAFFKCSEQLITEGHASGYLERLKDYFDYGLPIKLVGKNPLEYRVWGRLHSGHKKELESFFKSLPSTKIIIFDMRNAGVMGTMFYKNFRRLNRKKNIYYLDEKDSYQLKEIGNCKVFKSKEELNKFLLN